MKTEKLDKLEAEHVTVNGQLTLGQHIQIGDRVWTVDELAALLETLSASMPVMPKSLRQESPARPRKARD